MDISYKQKKEVATELQSIICAFPIMSSNETKRATHGRTDSRLPMKSKKSQDKFKPGPSTIDDMTYWLGRLTVEQDPKALRQWKKQHHLPAYKVLSQPVRHELNKFFFDVSANPSKAERKQLWYDLQLIDPTVSMSKIVRWFQNKRQYMKKQYGRNTESDPGLPIRRRSSHSDCALESHDSDSSKFSDTEPSSDESE